MRGGAIGFLALACLVSGCPDETTSTPDNGTGVDVSTDTTGSGDGVVSPDGTEDVAPDSSVDPDTVEADADATADGAADIGPGDAGGDATLDGGGDAAADVAPQDGVGDASGDAAGGDAAGDATSTDAVADGSSDASADAGSDATADAGSDATADVVSDATADAAADTTSDAGADAAADASADASVDGGVDAATDAASDASVDTTPDASVDTADAAVDAQPDANPDGTADGDAGAECTIDTDCAALEDGDLCNGTLVCNVGVCEIDPATVVTCTPAACQDSSTCEPATGQCVPVVSADDTPCDDGNACTLDEVCTGGTCASATGPGCDDGSICTDDTCDPAVGCINSPVDCADTDPCTIDSCDEALGCQSAPAPNGSACDDGDLCTESLCLTGSCLPMGPVTCDDGNPCTVDSCDSAVGCIGTDDLTASCDDGNACTTTACVAKTVSTATCEELGWSATNFGDPTICGESDGLLTCSGFVDYATAQAQCAAIGARLCSVVELANNETRGTGCGYDAQLTWSTSPCAAGGTHHWVRVGGTNNGTATECRSTTSGLAVVRCCADTANATGNATCDAVGAECAGNGSGCSTLTCDPATGCTVADVDPGTCDDGIDCTADSCSEFAGCANVADATLCDDDDPCTIDTCDLEIGACTNLPACDDGIDCTVDTCDALTGACASTPDDSACDDGQACSSEVCDPVSGCEYTNDAALCDDGNICTVDTCTQFVGCENVQDDSGCDDGDQCTVDTCDPSGNGACVFTPSPGLACTTDGGCSTGTCGTPVASTSDCAGLDPAATGSTDVCATNVSGAGCASTQADAAAACTAGGGRLCTLGEFQAGEVPEGTPCAEGNGYVWTGTPCDAASSWAFPLAAPVAGLTAECVLNVQDSIAQACCYDEDPATAAAQVECVPEQTPCAGDGQLCTQVACDDGCVAQDENVPTCCDTDSTECSNSACLACVGAADDYCIDTEFDSFCVDCALGGEGFGGACAGVDCTAECACDLGCDDANDCTTDTCSPTAGCVQSPDDPAVCGCTTDADCDDADPCTVDVCDGFTGCQNFVDPDCP